MKIRARLGDGPWHGDLKRSRSVDLSPTQAVQLHQRMDLDMQQILKNPESIGAWRREILSGYAKALRDSAALRGQAMRGQSWAERPQVARELRSRLLLARCQIALGGQPFEW